MRVLVETADLTEEQWLSYRLEGIGGSDAAAVINRNPWLSPMAVWLEKTGQVQSEGVGEAAYWGTVLERMVAAEFARRHPKNLAELERLGLTEDEARLQKVKLPVLVRNRNAILMHPEHDFILANIDRFVTEDGERGVLECKTTSSWRAWQWEDEQVPAEAWIQLQHYLGVTGLEFGYLAALIGGQKFVHSPRVEADHDFIDWLFQEEVRFWEDHVMTGVAPPIDGSEATSRYLDLRYPNATAGPIMLGEAGVEWVRMHDAAKAKIKEGELEKALADNNLKALLGDSERGSILIDGKERRVTWTEVSYTRLDEALVKEKHPELLEEFPKVVSFRRFDVR